VSTLLAVASRGATARLATGDWIALGAYVALALTIGAAASRHQRSADAFFLARRRIPAWAVTLSIVATSFSVVTFIGGPEYSYRGDLTYLAANIGVFLAVAVVALWFIPAYYRLGVTSVYELLGARFGRGARTGASASFLVGRSLASGARLFAAAIPLSLIAWGDLAPAHLAGGIVIVSAIATAYTLSGGIGAVIWTDVAQVAVLVGSAVAAIAILLGRIPLTPGEIVQTLSAATGESGASKLTLFDWRWSPEHPFSVPTIVFGVALLNLAAYGTDQDLVQRMLTCKSAARGAWSVVAASVVGACVVALFLALGLLLHIFYQRPDIMGPGVAPAAPDDTRKVFLTFILEEIRSPWRGVMLAGLLAAAMGSLDSALNAMASAVVVDFYRPLRPGRDERHYLRASRGAVALCAVVLAGVACACIAWHRPETEGIIEFALGVMVFAYGGMLGVFLVALFTKRGSDRSAVLAMLAGAAVVVASRVIRARWPGVIDLAFGWEMTAATLVSAGVCLLAPGWPRAAR
jgi:SSS family transporter